MITSLRDIEQRNTDLESEVFNLKMRLYYLTDKLRTNNISVADEGDQYSLDDRFSDKLREHDLRSMRVREENESLRRRVLELEDENMQLKNIVCGSSFQNKTNAPGGTSPTNYSLTQIEENRRTERHAAGVIAQHDAAVIAQLQEEVRELQQKKVEVASLVGDLAYRLDVAQSEGREKDFLLAEKDSRIKDQYREAAELRDQIKRQDALLESKLFKFDPLSGKSVLEPEGEGGEEDPQEQQQVGGESLIYRPRYEDEDAPGGTYSKSFTEFIQYKRFMFELGGLRNENALLRTQLERERGVVRRQEQHHYQINSSAAEITLLESHEIGRLTAELDRCKKAKFALEKRAYEAEGAASKLRRTVRELEVYRGEVELREQVQETFERSAREAHSIALQSSRAAATTQSKDAVAEGAGEYNLASGLSERYSQELRSIERTYRAREEEVMRAMESVVQHCRGLEARLGLRPHAAPAQSTLSPATTQPLRITADSS